MYACIYVCFVVHLCEYVQIYIYVLLCICVNVCIYVLCSVNVCMYVLCICVNDVCMYACVGFIVQLSECMHAQDIKRTSPYQQNEWKQENCYDHCEVDSLQV